LPGDSQFISGPTSFSQTWRPLNVYPGKTILQRVFNFAQRPELANGVPHLSILDGWWVEGYDGKNGWAFGADEATASRTAGSR
jgi:hypothetical protein